MLDNRLRVILIGGVGLLALAACSAAGTPAAPGSGSPSLPAATQSVPVTAVPTAAPVESEGQATPASDVSTKWAAFKDRVKAYTAMSPQISDLLGKWAAGDKTAAKEIATTLKPASEELAAWLDANPPDDCYKASWEPLREGADLVAAGAAAYLADDAATGSDKLMAGGSKLVEAGGTISDSGDRCRAAGG